MAFNKELLLRVRDEILAHPEHFDMAWWAYHPKVDGIETFEELDGEIASDLQAHACGTSACIAGWTVLLSETGLESNEDYLEVAAIEALGIDSRSANILFFSRQWPDSLQALYRDALATGDAKEVARAAAARIDAFIAEMEATHA